MIKHIFAANFFFITIGRLSDLEKNLEILLLRQQLVILQPKLKHSIKPSRVEKLTLDVLTTKFKQTKHQTTRQLRNETLSAFALFVTDYFLSSLGIDSLKPLFILDNVAEKFFLINCSILCYNNPYIV